MPYNYKNVFVVIPVYNEEKVIRQVIDEVKRSGDYTVLVVDDGSEDNTYAICRSEEDIIVLHHRINRGKGAAITTGLAAANKLKAQIVVTMDGDGQHDPKDIHALIAPIINDGFDVTLGTRMCNPIGMPYVRRIANHIGNFFTWIFYGARVSDSQSGFRAFSMRSVLILSIKADKYEYDSSVIKEINHNRLRYKEIPVKVRYTDYSIGKKHQQGFINGLKTLFRMIWGILS